MKKLTAKQVAAMSPEVRACYKKRLMTVQRNRRILNGIVAFAAVAAILALLSVTVFFKVSEVKVIKAGVHYSAEEIIDASGVKLGDSILRTDWDEVKERVEKKLPYVRSLKIEKSLDGRVSFAVSDATADKLLKIPNGYAVADDNLKLLEILKDKPENSTLTYLVMSLPSELTIKVGETVVFKDNDKTGQLYKAVNEAIEKVGLEKITGIDISDVNSITLEYQNRYKLYLGDSGSIEYKLQEAKKVIAKEDAVNPNQIGKINLSILKKVYVEPLETLEETTAVSVEVTSEPDVTEVTDTTDTTSETEPEQTDTTQETTQVDATNAPNME